MNVWLLVFPIRLFFTFSLALMLYVTPLVKLDDGTFPIYYYVLLIGTFALERVCYYAMFVSIIAFFTRISDPAVGGTNMTVLTTLLNLGAMWPKTFVIWFVGIISHKYCKF